MKRAIIPTDAFATGEDHSAAGIHMIEALGNLAGDAIGYPQHYAGVTVTKAAPYVVSINPGRLFIRDKVYDLDEPVLLDLQLRRPTDVNDLVWIAILLRGDVVPDYEQRLVLIDADTGETDAQSKQVRERYTINGNVAVGIPGPTPLKPSPPADECIVAWVKMSPTGIVGDPEPHPDHAVRSLYEVESRVAILEIKFVALEQSVKTIRTDLAAIAAAQRTAVRPDVFGMALRDIGAMRRELRILENEPRAYLFDPALVMDKWNNNHSLWLARIKEGVRFPWAERRNARLELYDPANQNVRVTNNLLLPKFTNVVRLSVTGGNRSKNVSQLQHTEITAVQRAIARSSVEYGPIQTVCENQREWANVGEAARTQSTLAVEGEVFQVVGLATNKQSADWNANPASVGHKNYDIQTVKTTSWTEYYWDYVTETFGLNGSCYGQTWLNSQATIINGIRLRFTRVGTAGDVHMVCCECYENGEPNLSKVIERSTVLHKDLPVGNGKVLFPFRPMYHAPGQRLAWFIVTTGNHEIACVEGNKYGEGSMFQFTDGAWAMPSMTEDFEFETIGPKFETTRTVVEFRPLTLTDGMSWIRLVAAGWAPEGTSMTWEFRLADETVWRALTPENAQSFYGLPDMVHLRLVMVGTTDLQAAIVLDQFACSEVGRSQGIMRALTIPINFGVASTSFTADLYIDQWKDGEHTAGMKFYIGEQEYTPTGGYSIWQDPEKPKRRRLTANFTGLPEGTTSGSVLIEGTKQGVDEWFGESVFIMAN